MESFPFGSLIGTRYHSGRSCGGVTHDVPENRLLCCWYNPIGEPPHDSPSSEIRGVIDRIGSLKVDNDGCYGRTINGLDIVPSMIPLKYNIYITAVEQCGLDVYNPDHRNCTCICRLQILRRGAQNANELVMDGVNSYLGFAVSTRDDGVTDSQIILATRIPTRPERPEECGIRLIIMDSDDVSKNIYDLQISRDLVDYRYLRPDFTRMVCTSDNRIVILGEDDVFCFYLTRNDASVLWNYPLERTTSIAVDRQREEILVSTTTSKKRVNEIHVIDFDGVVLRQHTLRLPPFSDDKRCLINFMSVHDGIVFASTAIKPIHSISPCGNRPDDIEYFQNMHPHVQRPFRYRVKVLWIDNTVRFNSFPTNGSQSEPDSDLSESESESDQPEPESD